MDVFIFTWHIEHLRMCPLKKGEPLLSPTFEASLLQETKWRLLLYPRGDEKGNGRFPSIYLFREGAECDPETVTVGYSLSVVTDFDHLENDEGVTRTVSVSESTRFRKNEGTTSDGFLRLADMFEGKDAFLVRGSLAVRCCLWSSVLSGNAAESSPGEKTAVLRGDSEFAVVDSVSYFPSPSGRRLFGETSRRCSALTRIPWQRRIVNWSIEDFSSLEVDRPLRLSTPTAALEGESQLRLTLQRLGASRDAVRLRFGVRVKDDLCCRSFARLELFVHDDAGDVFTVYEDEHFFEGVEEAWSFPLAIETRSNGVRESVLTRDGQLVLRFVFSISRKGADRLSARSSDLKEELRRMRETGKFCDVTIRSADRTFSVHKNVLCARSDVFCAMFENDTREKDTGVVDIADVDSDTLDRMVAFMYTDELDHVGQEDALKLYSATDKYQVLALKKLCASYLVVGLSVASVCDVLELAELHQDSALKDRVLHFVDINAKEVLSSCPWLKLMERNSRLTGEIMRHILVRKLES